jgi:hypothetical protein
LLGLTSTVVPTDCSLKISSLDGAWPSSLSGIIHTRYHDFIVNDSVFASLGLGESAVFAVCKYRKDGMSQRKTAVGCFDSAKHIPSMTEVEALVLDRNEERRVSFRDGFAIPQQVTAEFNRYMNKHHRKPMISIEQSSKRPKTTRPKAHVSTTEQEPTELIRELQLSDPVRAIQDLEAEIASGGSQY